MIWFALALIIYIAGFFSMLYWMYSMDGYSSVAIDRLLSAMWPFTIIPMLVREYESTVIIPLTPKWWYERRILRPQQALDALAAAGKKEEKKIDNDSYNPYPGISNPYTPYSQPIISNPYIYPPSSGGAYYGTSSGTN